MSNVEFLFILFIIIFQFDPLLTLRILVPMKRKIVLFERIPKLTDQNNFNGNMCVCFSHNTKHVDFKVISLDISKDQIDPETCYEVTLNATSSYHDENRKPTPVNIDKVKQFLRTPHDVPTTCSNMKIELKNEPDFRNIPVRNITKLSLTYRIEPTNKMDPKIEAYFCAENALQRASANATLLKDLLAFSEKTKPDLEFRIDHKSCCEEQDLHFDACCRKGYILRNNTCVSYEPKTEEPKTEEPKIEETKTEKPVNLCEVARMEKEKCGPSLGLIIIIAATSLVVMVVVILTGIRVWKIRHRTREQQSDEEGVTENAIETSEQNVIETSEQNAIETPEQNAIETSEQNPIETSVPTTDAEPLHDDTVSEYLQMGSFSTNRTHSNLTNISSRASSVNDRPVTHSEMLLDFKKHIPKTAITFTGTLLGSGQFGRVELANLLMVNGTTKECAVKMIRGRGTNDDEKELFHELELLYQIPTHPNVVTLLGGCMDADSPLYVVVEYCAKGNLLNYLQKKKHCDEYVNLATSPLCFRWKIERAIEICKGMIFLSNNQIIHRDLAARNILLDENDVAKISDFGMAKDVYLRGLYVKETAGFLPVRWMAIEAIESSMYSIRSDMWSFGILLWEVYMNGQSPYPTIPVTNELLDRLKEGYRMPKPENCSDSLYHLMDRCWLRKPDDRPSFSQTLRDLTCIKDAETKRESATIEETDFNDEPPVFEEPEEPREAYGDKILTDNTNAVGLDNHGRSRSADMTTNPDVETTAL